MSTPRHILVFSLGADDSTRYALPLADVERALPSVAITPLADVPPEILGLIDVEGEPLPVLDPRPRFGLARREQELADTIIAVRTPQFSAGLLVAAVEGVRDVPATQFPVVGGVLLAGTAGGRPGVAMLADGMVLLYDLARLMVPELQGALASALAREDP